MRRYFSCERLLFPCLAIYSEAREASLEKIPELCEPVPSAFLNSEGRVLWQPPPVDSRLYDTRNKSCREILRERTWVYIPIMPYLPLQCRSLCVLLGDWRQGPTTKEHLTDCLKAAASPAAQGARHSVNSKYQNVPMSIPSTDPFGFLEHTRLCTLYGLRSLDSGMKEGCGRHSARPLIPALTRSLARVGCIGGDSLSCLGSDSYSLNP